MSIFYRLARNPVRLFITAQTLLLIAFAWRDFPVFIFVAFAPMFALLDHPNALKESYLPFLVAIIAAALSYYFLRHSLHQSSIFSWIIYFTLLASVFSSYIFIQEWSQGELNKFGLILFVLAMEYLILKLLTENNPVVLADLLKYKPPWVRWNTFTGYTGTTLWILIANLTFYEAFFKSKQINWALCIAACFIVLLPIMYSVSNSYESLSKADVLGFYSLGTQYSDRPQYGELISRSGAWVSLLIIIFTVVKGMTKKGQR
jgi:hypothetical protein